VPRFGYAFHGTARAAAAARPPSRAHSSARLVAGEQEWLLYDGTNLVGRDHDCSVRIDSATLSRHHARIVLTSGTATIEDLGSKNGTLVNAQRVTQPVSLNDADQVQLGAVTVTYRLAEPLPSTMTRHERPT
jgi:pSer/pThr/pTyr-binding forkhead associated (FHA) protein